MKKKIEQILRRMVHGADTAYRQSMGKGQPTRVNQIHRSVYEHGKITYRRGYMARYFLRLLACTAGLVIVLTMAITAYSKKTAEQEIISLHQSILHQAVQQPARTMKDLRTVLERITENLDVASFLEKKDADSTGVDRFVSNEILGNYKRGNRFRIYLYDKDELRYSSDHPYISYNELCKNLRDTSDMKLEEDLSNKDGKTGWSRRETLIKGPILSSKENGLYRYSYYMIQPVRELLTGERVGTVLMQLSEVVLYDSFSDLKDGDRSYCITDGDGVVISAANKRSIGMQYTMNNLKINDRGPLSYGHGASKEFPNEMYFYENISGTDYYLVENIDLRHIFTPVHRATIVSFGMITLFFMMFLPFVIVSVRSVLQPISHIKQKMRLVAEGDLKARIEEEEKGKGELGEIADSFNDMVRQLETQVDEIRQSEQKRHLAELDLLQSQINPHFIYNTLSSIRFYVEMGKNEAAEKMLFDFSKILRKTLSHSERFVSLKEEMQTLGYYIELQKFRYKDRFEVTFELEEETLQCVVPDFILQPIVENAIFHSLPEKKCCHIYVRGNIEADLLVLSVTDDGVGMEASKIEEVMEKGMQMNHVGISNVNERLKLNFGEAYGVKILSEMGKGTEVLLRMPASTERRRS